MCVDCTVGSLKTLSDYLTKADSLTAYEKYQKMFIIHNEKLVNEFGCEPMTMPPFKGGSYQAMKEARDRIFNCIPRSQKATGIKALATAIGGSKLPPFVLVQNVEDVDMAYQILCEQLDNKQSKTLFARPCPTRPRHGFVDSRPVKTLDEIREVMRQTLEADDQGELILMPAIKAVYNSIWRPGLLAFGPGNDGATSGHNSHAMPLVPVDLNGIYGYGKAFKNARINDGEVAYIESVTEQKDMYGDGTRMVWHKYLTQMRGGPALAGAKPDYIPALTNVSKVVLAEGDLLEWETKAKNFDANTVVWHPGGSLASHYAVHCVLNNVPILTTNEPKVGDVLEPNSNKEPLDLQAAIRGIAAGSGFELVNNSNARNAVNAMLAGLHNTAVFEGQDSFYIGAAAAIMIRLGIAASCGEARHGQKKVIFNGGRDQIYEDAFRDLFASRKMIGTVYDIFANQHWSGGYGGKAWAKCTKAVADLDTAVIRFVKDPTEGGLKEVVSKLNMAVNCAHNNGWWMNKFTVNDVMDEAAIGHPEVWIDAVPVLYQLHEVGEDVIEMMHAAWLEADVNGVQEIVEKQLKVFRAQMAVYKNDNGLEFPHLQIKFVGSKNHISVNLTNAHMSKVNKTGTAKYVSGKYHYSKSLHKYEFTPGHAVMHNHLDDANKTNSLAGSKSDNPYYKLHVTNKNGKCQLKFDDGCVLVTLDLSSQEAFDEQVQDLANKLSDENYKTSYAAKKAAVAKDNAPVTPSKLPAKLGNPNLGDGFGYLPDKADISWYNDSNGHKVTYRGEVVQYSLVKNVNPHNSYYQAVKIISGGDHVFPEYFGEGDWNPNLYEAHCALHEKEFMGSCIGVSDHLLEFTYTPTGQTALYQYIIGMGNFLIHESAPRFEWPDEFDSFLKDCKAEWAIKDSWNDIAIFTHKLTGSAAYYQWISGGSSGGKWHLVAKEG